MRRPSRSPLPSSLHRKIPPRKTLTDVVESVVGPGLRAVRTLPSSWKCPTTAPEETLLVGAARA